MNRLIVRLTDGTTRQYDLPAQGDAVSIGRTPENDVCIAARSLSRRHATLHVVDGGFTLEDLGSKNGCYVDGSRIERALLRPGASFACGEVVFELVSPDPSPVLASPEPSAVFDIDAGLSRVEMHTLLGKGTADVSAVRGIVSEAGATEHRLRVLLRASQLLSEARPIDEVLGRILDLAMQILDVDRACVLLVDDDQKLRPRVQRTRESGHADMRHSVSVAEHVRRHRVAALFADPGNDPRLQDAASIIFESIRSCMCAPLAVRDEVIGVLYVDHRARVDRYDRDDLEFLAAFASQAAIAIDNSFMMSRLEAEARRRESLLRFFPPHAIDRVLAEADRPLQTQDAEVTALFVDISGYTGMVEGMPPRDVVGILNAFLPRVADVVFGFGGTLEKFVGDAALAVWGAPFGSPLDTERALAAAVCLQRAVQGLETTTGQPLQIHIGVHTGLVAAGTIGDARYVQYAAVGATTNITSRICGAAGPEQILISESTAQALGTPGSWPLDDPKPVRLRGMRDDFLVRALAWQGMDPSTLEHLRTDGDEGDEGDDQSERTPFAAR